MLTLTTAQQAALAKRTVIRRHFLWVESVNDLGAPDPRGFWDDFGNVIVDGKLYVGSGPLISVETMQAGADLTVPPLVVVMSPLHLGANELARMPQISQRPVFMSLGLFDTDTRALIPPLILRFRGKIDKVDIETPGADKASTITVTCESQSRALTIKRTATRSPASMAERAPGDKFYEYTTNISEQPLYFGRSGPG